MTRIALLLAAMVLVQGATAPATTPKAAALATLALVRSTFGDAVDEAYLNAHTFLATTVGDLRRNAQAVVDDDGTDPAAAARKINAVLNDLGNTANSALGIAARPREAAARQKLERFATALRAIAVDLTAATLPVATTTRTVPADSSLPRKTAAAALSLARSTLADTTYVGPQLHTFLTTNLRTLERAAQAVADDDAVQENATTAKVFALVSALEATHKNAMDIASRADEMPDGKRKSLQLAEAIRAILIPLENAVGPAAASGPDLTASFVARFPGGKTSYRIGEPIPLELEFRGIGGPDVYFSTESCGRASPETYVVMPSGGFVDPQADASVGGGSCPGSNHPLNGLPFILRVSLNDWFRFTAPGRYQLVVSSRRLRSVAGTPVPTLTASPLQFTVTPN